MNLSDSEKNIIDSLNNIINEGGDNEGETSFGCKYYDIDEFNNNFKNPDNFSILHLNIHSIQFHIIEDLRLALQSINNKFDIIAISESKINADVDPTVDITLDDFHPPVGTPTKASKGGVLLYISTELNFKPRHDLDIYKDRELESIFIEINTEKDKNIIAGVIYKHPSINNKEFNDAFFKPLLNKIKMKRTKQYIFRVTLTMI